MRREPGDEGYDIAQICSNGHVITRAVERQASSTSEYCPRCGARTILSCPGCGTFIRGWAPVGVAHSGPERPAYCHHCGKPYPWTEQGLKAAKELAQLLEASPEERQLLEQSIDDVLKDTPAATVAGIRLKNFMLKAGKGTAKALRDVLVDIASETAKRAIFG